MREECRSHRPTAPFGRGRPFTQGSTLPETYPISIYLYALSNLVSSLIFIGLAIFVLLRGTTQSANKIFALWCFSVSVWAFGVYKQTLAADPASAGFCTGPLQTPDSERDRAGHPTNPDPVSHARNDHWLRRRHNEVLSCL